QPFGGLGSEEAGMGKGEAPDLFPYGFDHAGVAMAETGNRRPAGSVEIALARRIDEIAPLAAHRRRQGDAHLPREDMRHGNVPGFQLRTTRTEQSEWRTTRAAFGPSR